MQLQLPVLLLLLSLLGACEGLTLRGQKQVGGTAEGRVDSSFALGAEWAAVAVVEADDVRFWAGALEAQEAELMRLQAFALKNSPSAHAENSTAPMQENSTAPMQENRHSDHRKSILHGIKLNLNPKTTADLVPALAMLKGMYEDGKERIAQLNAREKLSKQRYAKQEAQHDARIERIDAGLRNNTESADFHANETRDANRMWKYWERVRERQHRQFHLSLKIQHATMDKVKTMVDMYEKTISGKGDKNKIKGELVRANSGAAPEIVFLQEACEAAVRYCHVALEEVHAARAELSGSRVMSPSRAT